MSSRHHVDDSSPLRAARLRLEIWGPPLLAVLAAGTVLVGIGDLRARPRATIATLLVAGAAHAWLCLALRGLWADLDTRDRRTCLLILLGAALALRALLFQVPPQLSDDVYRYRWDGRVQAEGINPYRHPPGAIALESLRDEQWSNINYPRIRSIYPPLAQYLFRLTYGLSDAVAGFRAMATLGDLLTILLLLACLRAWRLPRWWVALYALHPMPALEFASSGHYDAWVTAAVLTAILAMRRRRPVVATLALTAGVLLKAWPAVFLPLWLRRRPAHVLLLGGVVVAAWWPFLDAGTVALQPWLDYAGRWRFNDGIFWALHAVTGSLAAAKAVAATLGLGLLGWLWRRGADPVRGGYWLLLAFILLMPTIHPWYLLWALPLAALAADRGWILLCSLSPTAYWILVQASGNSDAWVEPLWPRFLEYLPALAVWLHQAWTRRPPAPGDPPTPADARVSRPTRVRDER